VLGLLALIGVQYARESGSIRWAAVSGLALGALLHVRVLEPVLLAVVAGVWWLSAGWRKLRVAAVATTCVLALAMAGLFLAYNRALTGDPFLVPLNKSLGQKYYPGANRLGFGRDVGNLGWTNLDPLLGHGPADVVVATNHNLYHTNFELFGWASGSLVFVFLLVLVGRERRDRLMWAMVFVIWAGLSLYWFSSGPDFGARYWFQMIVPLAVLTVRGAQLLARRLGEQGLSTSGSQRVWAFVALASLLGVINVLPWRSLDKYHNYRGVRADVRKLDDQYNFGRSLVLVRASAWEYASAFALNPRTFDQSVSGPIYALDLGPESNQRLQRYYSDRPVWVIAKPKSKDAEFEVVTRPADRVPAAAQ
jgi:hypothetical protein